MGKKVTTYLEDDLEEGVTADETVTFSLTPDFGKKPVEYEIDLSAKNAQALRKIFKPYVEKARKKSTGKAKKKNTNVKEDREESQRIRQWAKDNNIPVAPRGRVPANVREAYGHTNT